jgi:hypothetical protein
VDVEFLGDLLDRFDALERLKRHAGFEFGIVSSSFAFHFVSVRFGFNAAPAHHNHSLATGLIFWVRLKIDSNQNYIRAENNILGSSVSSGFGSIDRFSHGFDSSGPTLLLSPLYVYALRVEFIDTSASVFDGNEILPVNLNLEDFDVARWSLQGSDLATRSKDYRINGTITTVTIPEPRTVCMISVMLGLCVLRRSRKS